MRPNREGFTIFMSIIAHFGLGPGTSMGEKKKLLLGMDRYKYVEPSKDVQLSRHL